MPATSWGALQWDKVEVSMNGTRDLIMTWAMRNACHDDRGGIVPQNFACGGQRQGHMCKEHASAKLANGLGEHGSKSHEKVGSHRITLLQQSLQVMYCTKSYEKSDS